jgi:hypothetical protein
MSYETQRKAFRRSSTVLLLAVLLLNASAHVFVHLGGARATERAISRAETKTADALSLFGKQDCLGCQTLNHLRLNSHVPFTQLDATDEVQVGRLTSLHSAGDPAGAVSDRAPPLV